MRARGRAALATLLIFSAHGASCVSEPSFEGRACSGLSPCPDGYTCGADQVCHASCLADEDCPFPEASCIDAVCVIVLDDACAGGGCLCTRSSECPSGQVCAGGVCGVETGAGPDAGIEPDGGFEPEADGGEPDAGFAADAAGPAVDTGVRPDAAPGDSGPADVPIDDPCRGVVCDDFRGGCREEGFCVPGAAGQPPSCSYTEAPEGSSCVRETVQLPGVCVSADCVECGADLDCDDGNFCTDERCDPSTLTCVRSFHNRACSDGNACTGGDACSNGACLPSITSCNDGNACTRNDSCNAAGGCAGTTYSCDDNNRCTSDVCNGSGGCSHPRVATNGLTPSGGQSISAMEVVLAWNTCANAVHYDVEIQFAQAGGTWGAYFTYDENNPTAPTTNVKTFYPCGAACNNTLRFRVRSFDGTAHGPWSAFSSFVWNNCRAC